MKRKATAVWLGTGKEGKGHLTTKSGVLNETQYSYSSRFEEGIGTNPDELIAAAHSGCFTMKVAFLLSGAGFTPERLESECTVTLEDGAVTRSDIDLRATVAGISEDRFAAIVKEAQEGCIISRLLNAEQKVTHNLNV